jgi:hypothetical protein
MSKVKFLKDWKQYKDGDEVELANTLVNYLVSIYVVDYVVKDCGCGCGKCK